MILKRELCTILLTLLAAGFLSACNKEVQPKGPETVATTCNNGVVDKDKGEICDTAIPKGKTGACDTEAECVAKPTDKCHKYELTGSKCTAKCVKKTIENCTLEPPITRATCESKTTDKCHPYVYGTSSDGTATCTPKSIAGCNIAKYGACNSDIECVGEDSICYKADPSKSGFCTTECNTSTPGTCGPIDAYECVNKGAKSVCEKITCGDGRKSGSEICDTSIPTGSPGACETEADCKAKTTDKCQPWVLDGSGCMAHCVQQLATSDCGQTELYGACDNNLQCKGEDTICYKADPSQKGFCTKNCDPSISSSCGDPNGFECVNKGSNAVCEKITCGDGRKSGSETCDTKITNGDGVCKTDADCKAMTTDKCHPYILTGSACTSDCVQQTLPGCNIAKYEACDADIECIGEDSICYKADPSKSGFCTTECDSSVPGSCGPTDAYECVNTGAKSVCEKITCGDGRKSSSETCDMNIPAGSPGACETEADCKAKTTDKCQPWVLEGSGCMAHCVQQPKSSDCGAVKFYGLCDNDLQCEGEESICFKPEHTSQGFCTTKCDTLGQGCKADQTCIPGNNSQNICTKSCDSTDPAKGCIRAEYVCRNSTVPGQSSKGCFFGLPVGSACSVNEMCQSGYCIQPDESDHFRGGYCVEFQNPTGACPTGSAHYGESPLCMKSCSREDSNDVDKDCRKPNYACQHFPKTNPMDRNPFFCNPIRVVCTDNNQCAEDYRCVQGPNVKKPGELEADKHCWKYGFGTKEIGDLCTTLTQCGGEKSTSGGDFKAVCMYMNNKRDLGMCSRHCVTTDSDSCPTDTVCINYNYTGNPEPYCFKKCTGDDECDSATTGRTCQLDATSGKRVCLPKTCSASEPCSGVLAGLTCQKNSNGQMTCMQP